MISRPPLVQTIFPAKALAPDSIPRMDAHLHTNWTDGADDVATMHAKAVEIGLEAMVFSEHARKSSADWFGEFAALVRGLSDMECKAFVGVEAKVDDFDGSLDSCDAILRECDVVMASVHRFPGEVGVIRGNTGGLNPDDALDLEYRLSLAVLENPAVDVLGHPFGMTYRRFGHAPGDAHLRAVATAAAANDVAFEINSRYHPDPWHLIDVCREAGAKVSLGSNAHSKSELGEIQRLLSRKSGE